MREMLALKLIYLFIVLFSVAGVWWAIAYTPSASTSPVAESHRYKCNVEQSSPNADGFSKTFAVDCAPLILTRNM